jgi:phosphoketolase
MNFERWSAGYGVIRHTPATRARVRALSRGRGRGFWEVMAAADRLASAGMWLTAHDTYASAVYLDGRPLARGDFKEKPEGHTGSSLNIVPAYVGYLLADAITGHTRGWIAEQGHAVSGIDGVNVLVGNVTPAHSGYVLTDAGLTRFVRDFYSYRLGPDGRQGSPRGSHVGPNTAGSLIEGGYLGFAGLQYVHLPLRGERLVAFLSDGAFEEQRGPDWAPRWWRREDSGLVAPFMILNGRRIDQRTTTAQLGGTSWFRRHLKLNSFDPIDVDGRDPASYAWAIVEMERRLEAARPRYPVRLPYGMATVPKGYGLYGAGTNAAHNLPLGAAVDDLLVRRFNENARRLWVPEPELRAAVERFQSHRNRPRERDHAMAHRDVRLAKTPAIRYRRAGERAAPMAAVDEVFVETCRANPQLRPRVGNPDEMRSNLLNRTLDALKHRVTEPEPGLAESVDGAVITALNEEAVACAALANKGGINLIHTYEAFGAKMHGAVRQEIIFAAHCGRAGRPQRWLSIPLVLTSHTYENGKNEQSHQDPILCEALMGEAGHVSRVVFPADYNSAAAATAAVYATRGQIWTMVVPKRELPVVFDGAAARRLIEDGAVVLRRSEKARIVLTAIGAYQLHEVLRASERLELRDIEHDVIYMFEPRRFSEPRSEEEARVFHSAEVRERFYPPSVKPRLFVTHTRSGRIQGLLQVIDTGPKTLALGYRNEGGTYDVAGMMAANHQSWAHILRAAARLMGLRAEAVLAAEEGLSPR